MKIYTPKVMIGDCRSIVKDLEPCSVQTCVTSPPYFGLRDYGVDGQIGQEQTPDEFVDAMVDVFREVRRVLCDDGTLWLNLGDSYARQGVETDNTAATRSRELRHMAYVQRRMTAPPSRLKPKDLIGIPWRVAFALQADGWWLRSAIVWHKPNPMPESVTDRPTSSYEMVFLLAKSERYFYDAGAVKEMAVAGANGSSFLRGKTFEAAEGQRPVGRGPRSEGGHRNLRNVWTIAPQPNREAHLAVYPPALVEPCIKAGSRLGDMVLDPFGGSGTTGIVAQRLGRKSILCEINHDYANLAICRILEDVSGPITRAKSISNRSVLTTTPLFGDL